MGNQQTTEVMDYAMHAAGSQSAKMPRPVYIRECASIVVRKKEAVLWENFLTWSEKMKCSDVKLGKRLKVPCKKKRYHWCLEKRKRKRKISIFYWQVICLDRPLPLPLALKNWISRFSAYSACSTSGEALALVGMILGGGFAENVICVTSSHFGSAEKEFRFPMEYGGQRPPCYTRTVTGSGAFLVSLKKGEHPYACISGITVGKIVDMNMKDTFNMGCCIYTGSRRCNRG